MKTTQSILTLAAVGSLGLVLAACTGTEAIPADPAPATSSSAAEPTAAPSLTPTAGKECETGNWLLDAQALAEASADTALDEEEMAGWWAAGETVLTFGDGTITLVAAEQEVTREAEIGQSWHITKTDGTVEQSYTLADGVLTYGEVLSATGEIRVEDGDLGMESGEEIVTTTPLSQIAEPGSKAEVTCEGDVLTITPAATSITAEYERQ